jgi:hypothetical protein
MVKKIVIVDTKENKVLLRDPIIWGTIRWPRSRSTSKTTNGMIPTGLPSGLNCTARVSRSLLRGTRIECYEELTGDLEFVLHNKSALAPIVTVPHYLKYN